MESYTHLCHFIAWNEAFVRAICAELENQMAQNTQFSYSLRWLNSVFLWFILYFTTPWSVKKPSLIFTISASDSWLKRRQEQEFQLKLYIISLCLSQHIIIPKAKYFVVFQRFLNPKRKALCSWKQSALVLIC